MLRKFLHFVQYHNFFTLAVMIVFMGGSAALAANTDAVVSKQEKVVSIDNTLLIATNFDTYDFKLTITGVSQDEERYYVDYSFVTMDITDGAWQPASTTGTLKVTRKELGQKDLGVYTAEQLGQVTGTQLAYLKEVQKLESQKGELHKVVATEYSGLVGRFLKPEEKEFEGYTPIKAPVDSETGNLGPSQEASLIGALPPDAQPPISRSEVRQFIADSVKSLLNEMNKTGASSATADTASAAAATTTESGADTQPPVITVTGNNPATIEQGSAYSDLGATVTDNVNHNLGVTAEGAEIDTRVLGTYFVYYTATDEAGNAATAKRTVKVIVPEAPTPAPTATSQPTSSPEVTPEPMPASTPEQQPAAAPQPTPTPTAEAVPAVEASSTPQ